MKNRISLLLAILFTSVILSSCMAKLNIGLEQKDVQSIIIANTDSLTTKTIEDTNTEEIKSTLSFINGLKKSNEEKGNRVGEVSIYSENQTIKLSIFDNGIEIDNNLYTTKDFDFEKFYNSLQIEEISMQK